MHLQELLQPGLLVAVDVEGERYHTLPRTLEQAVSRFRRYLGADAMELPQRFKAADSCRLQNKV